MHTGRNCNTYLIAGHVDYILNRTRSADTCGTKRPARHSRTLIRTQSVVADSERHHCVALARVVRDAKVHEWAVRIKLPDT